MNDITHLDPGTKPWRTELRETFRLAWPLALANLLQMLTYAIDVVFIARLGEEPLAASSLAAGHLTLVPELKRALGNEGAAHTQIIVGGVIPPQDFDALYAAGASAIFPPGTVIADSAIRMLEVLDGDDGAKKAAE